MLRSLVFVVALPSIAAAGTVVGKVELPATPPDRPPLANKGFLDRVANPLAPLRPVAATPYLVIVLEADDHPATPAQISWDLLGESFVRPVLVAPVGATVTIKNRAKTPRSLDAVEDSKLVMPAGPLNPDGAKTLHLAQAGKIYTIGDRDAPHVKGRIAVVNTNYIAPVDANNKFEIPDIPPGGYKLRVFYKDHWLDQTQSVDVPAKGKAEPTVKIAAWDKK
jgi:hypothetical protein